MYNLNNLNLIYLYKEMERQEVYITPGLKSPQRSLTPVSPNPHKLIGLLSPCQYGGWMGGHAFFYQKGGQNV